MSAENKAIVRRFYDAFGHEDFATLEAVLAPDLAAYAHGAAVPASRGDALQGIKTWNAAFSGSRYSVHEQLAEGDRVATRVTLRAVHDRGEFMGVPPTGARIELNGISIERVAAGRIVERRVSWDQLGLMQQLGLVPLP